MDQEGEIGSVKQLAFALKRYFQTFKPLPTSYIVKTKEKGIPFI
jgi:hypothetical protein